MPPPKKEMRSGVRVIIIRFVSFSSDARVAVGKISALRAFAELLRCLALISGDGRGCRERADRGAFAVAVSGERHRAAMAQRYRRDCGLAPFGSRFIVRLMRTSSRAVLHPAFLASFDIDIGIADHPRCRQAQCRASGLRPAACRARVCGNCRTAPFRAGNNKFASMVAPARARDRDIRWCIFSRSATVISPFAMQRWLVTTMTRKPARFSRANAFGHPWKNMKILPAGHVMTFGRLSIDDAITIQEHCFGQWQASAYVRSESGFGQSCLIETVAERLGARVIFGRPDVDEHSVLLERIHTMLEQARKYILFQAGWSVRNVLQYGAIEHVHATVYDSRNRGPRLLTKANDSIHARPVERFHIAPRPELCVPPC